MSDTTANVSKVKPDTRRKGYRQFSSQAKSQLNPKEFVERLAALRGADSFVQLSVRNKELFGKIQASYQKIVDGQELCKEDYLLSGHELDEVRSIPDDKIPRYVAYRYKYNKYPELKIANEYPPCVQIEPASICNYRCVMCYQIDKSFSSKSKGHMGLMELEVFKHAVDELQGNVEAVTLASRGEPFLNSKLLEMLEYAKGKFLALKLNTNASLLTEKAVHALLSSDIQTLVFSVDSADPETYERIRVNGNYDRVRKNIEMFQKIRTQDYAQSKIITKISGVKLNDDQDIDTLVDSWQELVDQVAFVHYNPWESAYENPENTIQEPCSELWRRMFLWWDGRVNPCDFDYKSTLTENTDIHFPEKTLQEIWMSDLYLNMRQKHLAAQRDQLFPCNRCVSV
ncbi:radical SAM/SPASM domain-containing protein [Cohaesibacter gelatinilyticus]|uniref:4Fe-4S single cluster domain-containing protein n=1 Tax=Cohaesibacter gelatinilyticus TaxID=372072 RepID=A0A285PEI1_9HYPH|nr:radical SAM protein [Cohaesibacter gelatinilyticus]SNZ20144.1 4Fe-4S single cluster domain-containing protein [Cohaesibacter gelatinilyticus]